ncbi:MAG: RagB/SusD family nutrient uptake outer membrane protein [Bacteroidales bacterium]|nr:RagB/SusD family nutrient uptake outer membrane protein [Bacteroidales bacterium]MCB8999385.1 RagB/SusD family nutrient uptake outer membrane protein [Bacteroidales bacterium]
MKTLNKILITSLAGLSLLTGCEKFLDKPLQENLTQESFPKTASDALLATNAAYSTLRTWAYNSGGFPLLDIMSDDASKGSNPDDASSELNPFDNFTFTTTASGLGGWWSTLYQGIRRANVVIEKVPDIEMDESLKFRYLGEAHFLRGLYYFDLVRAWGDVPIVTESSPPLKVGKSDKSLVYSLIIDDFTFAMQHLPLKKEYAAADNGRATRGAAKAYLAKVYLFQQDFFNAEKYALEVIDSADYSLEPNFADANSEAGENGPESIFEVGALNFENTYGNQYANTQGVRGNPNRGWGFNRPTINLQNSFEADDPRKDATIIFLGETIDGVYIEGDGQTPDVTTDDLGNTIEIECYNQKVWIDGTNTATQFGYNRRLLRYADVLLIAAEALNENNKPAQALVYVNEVRARARGGNPAILPDITETNKDALRDLILDERRHELAMEGHRFWDLVRTGKASSVLGPLGFTSPKNDYLPIPQSEIDISQGSLIQNPNWQ